MKIYFNNEESFYREYTDLLPVLDENTLREEEVVFSHNDVQENNFMHKYTLDETGVKNISEVKILDFEYSGVNFRGMDLAGYIVESGINYKVDAASEYPWFYDDSKFPSFGQVAKEGTIDVDYMISEYLTNFYQNHLPNLIPNYE